MLTYYKSLLFLLSSYLAPLIRMTLFEFLEFLITLELVHFLELTLKISFEIQSLDATGG